jgi:hypothetical protein
MKTAHGSTRPISIPILKLSELLRINQIGNGNFREDVFSDFQR